MYLIQYELDGVWYTCKKRRSYTAAKSLARKEYREMRGAHMTAVISEGDENFPFLRRTYENNFQLE